MQKYIGHLAKMSASLADPVTYSLKLGDECLNLNQLIGKNLTFVFTGLINCVGCGKEIKKSYQQGYCFLCSQRLARCDFCIVRPEKCHFHLGTCREPSWGQDNCFMPHIVYLANSSGLKVGITRETQIPTRWIDQGAIAALAIFRVQSRYQSGLLELVLAEHVADKTNWRQMLRHDVAKIDLAAARDELFAKVAKSVQAVAKKFTIGNIEFLTQEQAVVINYPMEQLPRSLKSLNFNKTDRIAGTLDAIKGQYLILDTGVANIRALTGHQVQLSVE